MIKICAYPGQLNFDHEPEISLTYWAIRIIAPGVDLRCARQIRRRPAI